MSKLQILAASLLIAAFFAGLVAFLVWNGREDDRFDRHKQEALLKANAGCPGGLAPIRVENHTHYNYVEIECFDTIRHIKVVKVFPYGY